MGKWKVNLRCGLILILLPPDDREGSRTWTPMQFGHAFCNELIEIVYFSIFVTGR